MHSSWRTSDLLVSDAGAAERERAGVAPESIRNVVLIGATGAGKTALQRAIVALSRPGRPWAEVGATVGVWPQTVAFAGPHVTLIDSPGVPDFRHGVVAALRAADAALFVIAAGGGLPPSTEFWWHRCVDREIPRAIVVTHLDKPGADYDDTVALCERLLGDGIMPMTLPVYAGGPKSPGAPVAVIDVATRTLHDYSSGASTARAPDPEHLELVRATHEEFVETLAAMSDDDELLDRHLDGEELDDATITAELAHAVRAGMLHPVFAAVPASGVGCEEVLRFLATAFPSPVESTPPRVLVSDGAAPMPLSCDPDGVLAGEVIDRHGNGLTLVRIHSGTLVDGESVVGHDGIAATVSLPAGTEVGPGVLLDLRGFDDIAVGTAFGRPGQPVRLESWELPPTPFAVVVDTARIRQMSPLLRAGLAVVSLAVPSIDIPSGDWEKAVARIRLDDPAVRIERGDPETFWCVGARHARLVTDLLGEGLGTQVPLIDAAKRDEWTARSIELTVLRTLAGAVVRALTPAGAKRTERDTDAPDGTTRLRVEVPTPAVAAFLAAVLSATDGTAVVSLGGLRNLPRPPTPPSRVSTPEEDAIAIRDYGPHMGH